MLMQAAQDEKRSAYSNYINSSCNKTRAAWKIVNFERNKNVPSNCYGNIEADEFATFFATIADKIVDSLRSGLDPAWPLFPMSDTEGRLDFSDAKYVQVIHTCASRLGFPVSIGHSDYYPNGGGVQPGCGVMDVTGELI
nr:unnamed protein product [Callosobruchus analis]